MVPDQAPGVSGEAPCLRHCCQGRPEAPPVTQNASQKSLGDKSKEVGEQNLTFCFKGKLTCWKF